MVAKSWVIFRVGHTFILPLSPPDQMGFEMRTISWFVIVLFVGCLGCGTGGTRRPIHGSANYQNKPIENGSITFLTAATPSTPVGGALILDGRYELPEDQGLEPGTYRVAISMPSGEKVKQTPEEIAAKASPRAKEGIPDKYNSASILTVEVLSSGTNEFNFDLE